MAISISRLFCLMADAAVLLQHRYPRLLYQRNPAYHRSFPTSYPVIPDAALSDALSAQRGWQKPAFSWFCDSDALLYVVSELMLKLHILLAPACKVRLVRDPQTDCPFSEHLDSASTSLRLQPSGLPPSSEEDVPPVGPFFDEPVAEARLAPSAIRHGRLQNPQQISRGFPERA